MRLLMFTCVALSLSTSASAQGITYGDLAAEYSLSPPAGFAAAMRRDYGETHPNSCAIRLAFAMDALDAVFFDNFQSPAVFQHKPIRARELWAYLVDRIPGAISIPTRQKGRDAIDGSRGIVYFERIRPRSGQRGVSWHISLWNGSRVVDGGDYFTRARYVYFLPLDN